LKRVCHDCGPPGNGQRLLLASGDGGLRPFGEAMAKKLASWGYDVYHLDTRHYLRSLAKNNSLTPEQVQTDFETLIRSLLASEDETITLLGWSAGAALATVVAADPRVKKVLRGVGAVSLPLEGVLGWSWMDMFQFLPGIHGKAPTFDVRPYVAAVPPTPLLILESSGDKWVSQQDAQALFQAAREPKKTVFLEAGGHSFPRDRDAFFRVLREGMDWIGATRRAADSSPLSPAGRVATAESSPR
jgi:dienelactone hydrolase